MRAIERPAKVLGMEPSVDAIVCLHRGLIDELYRIVSHGLMTNADKFALMHELSRPEHLTNPRAAVAPLRAVAASQLNTLTPPFYMRASDYFEEAARLTGPVVAELTTGLNASPALRSA